MKCLPLLCFLACSWAEGDISPEPNVVFQSVYLGENKPNAEVVSNNDECRGHATTYNDMNIMMRRIMNGLYPQSTRYKRDDSSYADAENFDDKTLDRILEALEELKQDNEKNQEEKENETVKEKEEDTKKSRLDEICKKGGKWHKKMEECHAKKRKGDIESYKKMLKENLEELLSENKDLEKKLRKISNRKKDWKDELERRRLKESLAESWPRTSEERMPEDMYYPMSYHHQSSHQRGYPTGGYMP